jgi:chemotaxis protein methyltransferase CheR
LSEPLHRIPHGTARFFAEKHHLAFLAETVVSDLKAGATLGRPRQIRVWSAACSTGEEAYSIAITLLEAFGDLQDSPTSSGPSDAWRIEVFASDRDGALLATALDRIYNEASLDPMPPLVKARYFQRGKAEMAGLVRIKQRLADVVRFRQVNLQEDSWPVQGTFDAIFFRNALHSFAPETHDRILRELLRYLNPHAYLILGSTEHVPQLKDAVLPLGQGIHQLRPRVHVPYTGDERRTDIRKTPSFE